MGFKTYSLWQKLISFVLQVGNGGGDGQSIAADYLDQIVLVFGDLLFGNQWAVNDS